MTNPLRWGILGTGRIAGQFARDLASSRKGRLVAVGSRTPKAAEDFVAAYSEVRAHGSYQALLADREVDAIYLATPHPQHLEWAVATARAKKHLLCEKPIGLNAAQALRMIEAARVSGVALMEAFMYRCHPQTRKAVELVRTGVLGDLTLIQASFGFRAPFDPASRLWDPRLGGGGILDVGCYPVSMARLLAGAAVGKPFLDPVHVAASGVLHPVTKVDASTAAQLRFETGLVAQVSTAITTNLENTVRVYGTKGSLVIPQPWLPAPGQPALLELSLEGQAVQRLEVTSDAPQYALEADALADAIAAGRTETEAMSWADTLGNLRTLDRWRAEVGVVYPGE